MVRRLVEQRIQSGEFIDLIAHPVSGDLAQLLDRANTRVQDLLDAPVGNGQQVIAQAHQQRMGGNQGDR